MGERRKTAAELMAELQSDAAYRERRSRADQKRFQREQEYAELLAPVFANLRELGIAVASLEELIEKHSPLSAQAVDVLLSSLESIADDRVRESIVRALGAAGAQFDGRPLIRCFERTSDEGLRWAVLNTIAITRPHSIDDWLASIRDTAFGEMVRQLSIERD